MDPVAVTQVNKISTVAQLVATVLKPKTVGSMREEHRAWLGTFLTLGTNETLETPGYGWYEILAPCSVSLNLY